MTNQQVAPRLPHSDSERPLTKQETTPQPKEKGEAAAAFIPELSGHSRRHSCSHQHAPSIKEKEISTANSRKADVHVTYAALQRLLLATGAPRWPRLEGLRAGSLRGTDGDREHGSGTSLVFDEEHGIIKVGNLLSAAGLPVANQTLFTRINGGGGKEEEKLKALQF